jgi:hypothetical protein
METESTSVVRIARHALPVTHTHESTHKDCAREAALLHLSYLMRKPNGAVPRDPTLMHITACKKHSESTMIPLYAKKEEEKPPTPGIK